MQEYLSRHNDARLQNFMQSYLKWDAVSSSTFRCDSDVVVVTGHALDGAIRGFCG